MPDTTMKRVCFISKSDAERLQPRDSAAVISVVDTAEFILGNRTGWHSYYCDYFLDGEYDLPILLQLPEQMLASYMNAEQAERLKSHIETLVADGVGDIIVHCHAGRGRSAGVALYISEKYGYNLVNSASPGSAILNRQSQELAHHNRMVVTLLHDPYHFERNLQQDDSQETPKKSLKGRITEWLFG